MIHPAIRNCIRAVFILSLSVPALSQSVFVGSGNFSDPANWSGGALPSAGSTVVIEGSCTYDMGAPAVSYASVQLGPAPTASLTWEAGATNTLDANIVHALAGQLDLGAGTLLVRNALYVVPTCTVVPGSSTVILQGANLLSESSQPLALHDLRIDNAPVIATFTDLALTGDLEIAGGSLAVESSLTLAGNWTNHGEFLEGDCVVEFSGSVTQVLTAPGGETLSHVRVNQDAGACVQLDDPLTVLATLDLVSGEFCAGGAALTPPNETHWKTLGNLPTADQFLGTAGDQDLRIKTNRVERAVITAAGLIGIGVSTPIVPLHLAGELKVEGEIDVSGNRVKDVAAPTAGTDAANKDYVDAQAALDDDPTNELNLSLSLNGTDLELEDVGGILSVDLSQLTAQDDDWTIAATDLYRESGAVTIGSTLPAANTRLTVRASAGETRAAQFLNDGNGAAAHLSTDGSGSLFLDSSGNRVELANGSTAGDFEGAGGTVRLGTSTSALRITDGNQGNGKVLTSDGNGHASWQSAPGGNWEADGNRSLHPTGRVGIGVTGVPNTRIFEVLAGTSYNWAAKISQDTKLAWLGGDNAAAEFKDSAGSTYVQLGRSDTPIRIVDGNEGNNKVLTSDSNGKASWQAPLGGNWEKDGSSTVHPGGRVGIGVTSAPNGRTLEVVAAASHNWAARLENDVKIALLGGESVAAEFKDSSTGHTVELGRNDTPIRIVDGNQGNGRVLTSDSNGKASWQDLPVGEWTDGGAGIIRNGRVGIGLTELTAGQRLLVAAASADGRAAEFQNDFGDDPKSVKLALDNRAAVLTHGDRQVLLGDTTSAGHFTNGDSAVTLAGDGRPMTVVGIVDDGPIAVFKNDSATDPDGIVIQIGETKGNMNGSNDFVTFKDSSGNVVGRIEGYDHETMFLPSVLPPGAEAVVNTNLNDLDDLPSFTFDTGNLPFIDLDRGSLPSLDFSKGSLPSLSINFSSFSFDFNRGSLPSASLDKGSRPSLSFDTGSLPSLDVDLGLIGTLRDMLNLSNNDVEELICWGATYDITSPLDAAYAYVISECMDKTVIYESGGGDYAEWLPKLDPTERLWAGDIVGVHGGKISRETEGAEQIMVISTAPIVLGNIPPEGEEHLYSKVGFMGQVPTKVLGDVEPGDYILASGLGNGYGVAVSPGDIELSQLPLVVGRAWDIFDRKGNSALVNVVVGVKSNEWVEILERHHTRLEALEAERHQTETRLARLESMVQEMLGAPQSK